MVAQAARPMARVQVDRDLLVGIRAALAETFTRRGHVAIKNEREGGGYCSHRRCSPICVDRRALFLALDAAIEGQGGLFDEAAG